jgi:hypothetical protein
MMKLRGVVEIERGGVLIKALGCDVGGSIRRRMAFMVTILVTAIEVLMRLRM